MARDVMTYRRALVPLAAAAVMGAFWGSWAALVPEVQLRTGASPAELGSALLFVGVGALPAMLLTGRLWARFGRGLVGATLLLFGFAAILPALAPDVVLLAVALALVGASSGALDVAMNAEISDLEAASGKKLMYPLHALFSLAMLTSSISVGVLRGAGVEPLPLLATVSVAFLLLAAPALLRQRRFVGRQAPSEPALAGSAVALRRTLLLLGLLCALAWGIEDALMSWSALHLERSLAAPPAIGGAGPGLFAGAMFVGRALGQAVARRVSERHLLVGSGGVAAAGTLLSAWAPSAEAALVGLIVAGAGVSLAGPALFSRAGRLAGAGARGSAMSTLTVLGYLGFIFGPLLMGSIAGATDLRVSFTALAAVALLLAAIARATLPDDRPAPAREEELPPVVRA